MKINQLQPNESNPRLIKGEKFKKLVQSIKDFPEMLELRPIVIDEDNVILGGNMRYRACVEAGLKEVPVKIAKGLTEEQKQEFIVKDNVGFGEWDWAMLGNEWDNVKIKEWGLDVWQPEEDISNNKDYSINSIDEKLERFLDAKIKNITIPFETQEFTNVVEKLEKLLDRYNCEDYRALLYKIFENEKL
tara:strand:+ start:302 stop:868 length:567 start_codon:yes stop_codon:yes gene_type:complete